MKRWIAGMLALVLVFALAACGGGPSENVQMQTTAALGAEEAKQELYKIRFGTMPYYLGVPCQVIREKELGKKYGFEMEVVNFSSGGPMAEALGAGEWDIGAIGAGGMIAIPNYNAYLVYDVENVMDGAWIMARPDSAIVQVGNTLADYPEVIGSAESVKGATILGTIGNISHYMAIDYVQKMGLTMGDVNFLNMETSNVYTAFVSGSGDLACMGSPSAALKLLDEGYVLVGGLKQQGVPQQDSILVSEDFYQNHRQAAVAFMAAWMEASALLNADQTYEKTCMSTFYREQGRTDFTEADIAREAEWNTYTDPENYAEKPLGAWMQSLISCYVDAGVQDAAVLEALERNTVTDILQDALALYNSVNGK